MEYGSLLFVSSLSCSFVSVVVSSFRLFSLGHPEGLHENLLGGLGIRGVMARVYGIVRILFVWFSLCWTFVFLFVVAMTLSIAHLDVYGIDMSRFFSIAFVRLLLILLRTSYQLVFVGLGDKIFGLKENGRSDKYCLTLQL